jgi:hypothetical protein
MLPGLCRKTGRFGKDVRLHRFDVLGRKRAGRLSFALRVKHSSTSHSAFRKVSGVHPFRLNSSQLRAIFLKLSAA